MHSTPSISSSLNVGDWVSFDYGSQRIWAQIIEDRGGLGVRGRRLLRLRFRRGSEEVAFEMPEDELVRENLSRSSVIDFLKHGGLVEILHSNLTGGSEPRVWLTLSPQGKIGFTFEKDRGIVGGEVVPFNALTRDHRKVFLPDREGVIGFVKSFGLTQSEAEDVVRSVGTEAN
ncbi:MAG: hypothetical protein KF708_12635 [Pirellulales bacterium]|nr:hypothetical protein [Pirellulales bacterium]